MKLHSFWRVSVYCSFVKAARRALGTRLIVITLLNGVWLAPGFYFAMAFAVITCTAAVGLTPEQLRCEYLSNPLGIDVAQPRLSWVLRSGANDARGEGQTAYRVLVASTPNSCGMKQAISGIRGKFLPTKPSISCMPANLSSAACRAIGKSAYGIAPATPRHGAPRRCGPWAC